MKTPRARGAFDFETYEWVNPLCCGLLTGPPEARHWEYVTGKPKEIAKTVIQLMLDSGVRDWHAFNGGRFDALFILEALVELGLCASGYGNGGRLICLEITKGPTTIRLCDSQALVSGSLASASEDFELKARKEFEDYKKDMRALEPSALESGCKADCEVLLQLLERVEGIVESFGGEMQLTFSSTALNILKASSTVYDTHQWRGENTMTRHAYFGGRVEVFRHKPEGQLLELDINSSYPWSMSQTLPGELLGHENKHAAKFLGGNRATFGIFRCTIQVPETYLPVLPVRDESGGMYFPTGKITGWWAENEILYALETGCRILHVYEAVTYKAEQLYDKFVEKLFALKRESTGALRNFAKLMLNGCYGKFGQKPERENLRIFADASEACEYMLQKPKDTRPLSIDPRFIMEDKFQWSKHTHYALASAITAFSRVRLHQFLSQSEGIAYCDTDSVHASASSIETSDLLGDMKLEIESMTAKYYAPKIYELHTDKKHYYACKGFPTDKASFRKVVKGECVSKERQQLYKRQLRNGNEPQRIVESRTWAGFSRKRAPIAGNSQGDTRPWDMKEIASGAHLTAVSPLWPR